MPTRKLPLLLLLFFSFRLQAQVCTNLGQNPETAFPVCGSSSFSQTTVPLCGNRKILSPCMDTNPPLMDLNPYWYKFTCFTSGLLGFLITPININDDYDWQLFDITGHNPGDVFTNSSLFVACNWSGLTGKTGASSAGNSLVNCAGTSYPLFSAMPALIQSHNYLLLISHFSSSQSGYSLDFKGGTANITDTTPPKLLQARTTCDGKHIQVRLNKKMKCSSLATDGSDFSISANSSSASVAAATGTNCNTSFDMDSLVVTLNKSLQPGNYVLTIKNGADNNTLTDNCGVDIPAGDTLPFSVFPAHATDFDSIAPVKCAPDELVLVFKDPLMCNSVAADGSDFILTGTSASVIGANTFCNNEVSNIVTLKLSSPVFLKGTQQVTITKGTDGNTVINECLLETPAGEAVSFTTKDTVSAAFNYSIGLGCKADTGFFVSGGNNDVNFWRWNFKSDTSAVQNPQYIFPGFGPQHVTLFVTNGFCSDSASVDFSLDNELKADFTLPVKLCPQDAANFKDTSIGNITAWRWDFGNGQTSSLKNPPPQNYAAASGDKDYQVTLVIQNEYNCYDTSTKSLKVLYTCFIGVPSAFTPNGDGRNDYLYPLNGWLAKNLLFRVYNRYGQLLFQTTDVSKKWDGTFKGIQQKSDTYVWTLQYTLEATNQSSFLKGTTVLIR